ncbi:MAG: hypothetical protein KJT03_01825, partial [Verrucomicrobiae bacterium]|nr:hypothetical protein [Verrucomicrobiae bacterium]
LSDASEAWGIAALKGLWETALAGDFTGDGFPDLFLGGLGLNNEISFRGEGDGKLVRYLGRFSERGPPMNLNAYDWYGDMRLFDGLRDFTEIEPSVFRRIPSFKQSAALSPEAFIDRTGFTVKKTYAMDHFASGILVNQGGKGFRFVPLPLEGQYGRVWDAVAEDVNADGHVDLILLLGQVSPHYRSIQDEGSFVSVLLEQGDGTFAADIRPPLDKLPSSRIVGLGTGSTGEESVLNLQLEDGRTIRFLVNP